MAAWKFGKRQVRCQPRLGRLRILLRHGNIDAQSAYRSHVKQLRLRSAGARIDEMSDVGVASRDDSVEGRVDFLERLQFLETPYVGFGRSNRGFLRLVVSVGVVYILLGNGIGVLQILVAFLGNLRKAEVGLGGVQIGAGLFELLVNLGRLDLRE